MSLSSLLSLQFRELTTFSQMMGNSVTSKLLPQFVIPR